MRSRLSCELTASLLVATCNDTDSYNRLNLIQSLVPTYHVYNGYISSSGRLMLTSKDVYRHVGVVYQRMLGVHHPL